MVTTPTTGDALSYVPKIIAWPRAPADSMQFFIGLQSNSIWRLGF
jgi:hypothetical protein